MSEIVNVFGRSIGVENIGVVILAAVVALGVSYVLYGIVGKRFLGANDDFWEVIRKRAIPTIDKIGRRYGLYAKGRSIDREYAATIEVGIEEFERELEKMGYHRNPLASLKRDEYGRHESGSWARRYGTFGTISEIVKTLKIPLVPRFIKSFDDIFALRQIHITLYEYDDGINVYAHDEFNSLNPLVAWFHYRGVKMDVHRGVRQFRSDLDGTGIKYRIKNPEEPFSVVG